MKITFKIFVFITFILILSLSHVYAIDMSLDNNIVTIGPAETITDDTIENEELNELYSHNLISPTNPTPTVTHTSSTSDSVLSISDIIDVILIAVCIVLIFLGIAILIRCK